MKSQFRVLFLCQIASGEHHCIAISADNRVYTWGRSLNNRTFGMGAKNEGAVCAPAMVDALKHLKIVTAACGHFHSVLLDKQGKVYTAGFNFYGQLGLGNTSPNTQIGVIPSLARENMVMAAAGAHHTLLLTENGEVFSFGCNLNGELGLGSTTTESYVTIPNLVSSLLGVRIVKIACGAHHSVAVSDKGQLYAWGCNAHGQLGLANFVSVDEPQLVTKFPSDTLVKSVSCGAFHTVALLTHSQG
eukprot:c8002_g1_i4.p1 GENE.c8002_g1_i4~~c8002_g1_i4.p1  ORF type:complete len:245 (+),score=48.93 c8002_g1_i4:636-1370(+)